MTTKTAKKPATPQEEIPCFTREEVEILLLRQIEKCAEGIEGNMTEYCAKRKIRVTELVAF